MAPPVDLSELQNVVGKYVGDHGVIVSAGPLAATAAVRVFTKNKLATMATVAGAAWLSIQALSGSSLKLMHDQFGYLISLLNGFRG